MNKNYISEETEFLEQLKELNKKKQAMMRNTWWNSSAKEEIQAENVKPKPYSYYE